MSSILQQQKIHYGWIVVGATFLTLLLGAGVRSTPGILMVPFETEFHWSRSTISLAVAINLLVYGLMGPFAAAMMERFGVRRMMLLAITCIAIGVALTTFMRESWQLILLWGFVVGCGSGITANVLAATVATRWFTKNRGLVVGLLTSAAAAGQLIFLPAMASITTNFGWRPMVLAIAVLGIVIFPLVAIFMRDRPADIGIAPYGETDVAKQPAPTQGNPVAIALGTLRDGLRSRDFWLLAGSFFICGASTNGLIGTHLIPACIDNGITELTGAGMLALIGAFNFVGTTGSGWLSDRVDNRILLAVYYSLRGLSLLFLPFSFVSLYGLSLFSIFYGLDWIATVPPTVRLTANCFGKEKASLYFGWIFASHQLGSAAAAYFGGVLRTDLGSYLETFLISGTLCFAAALLVMWIGVDWRRAQAVEALAS
jgi:predicted MFS family arabinose efflux permease